MSRSTREIVPDRLSSEQEQEYLKLIDEIKERFKTDQPVKARSNEGQDLEGGWVFKNIATWNEFGRIDPKVLLTNGNSDRMIIDPKTFLEWQK